MATLLLTGATGLVGARLLPRLAADGHACRALVRRPVDLPEGVTPVTGDLDDPSTLLDAVGGVDAVVHLAALFRTGDEAAIWAVNLDGTRNLLDAVRRRAPGARVVMTSTGHVYDADGRRPAREDDPCAPTAAYPASKLAAEQLLRASGLTWSVLRLPFVYGDGDGHLQAMPALAERFGLHPAHTYSVVHHRDVAAVVRLALEGVVDGRVVNVADDAPVSVHEMAVFAGATVEGSSEPLANPWSGRMDVALLRSTGFRPGVPTMTAAARDGLL